MSKVIFLPLLWVVLVISSIFFTCAVHRDVQVDSPSTPTIADYKVAFIYRGQFRVGEEGEKDFYRSVTRQIEWLRKRYEVFKLEYVYGFNVTQNLILRYAILYYEEKE